MASVEAARAPSALALGLDVEALGAFAEVVAILREWDEAERLERLTDTGEAELVRSGQRP